VVTPGHPAHGRLNAPRSQHLRRVARHRLPTSVGLDRRTPNRRLLNLTGRQRVCLQYDDGGDAIRDKVLATLRERDDENMGVDPKRSKWEHGAAHTASPTAGTFEPMEPGRTRGKGHS